MDRVDGRSYRGSSNMTTFGIHKRHGNYYYDNYLTGGGGGGGGIEFRAHTNGEEPGGVTSPPLWKTSPCTSPPETTPLRSFDRHQHYRLLSPTSRSQAITRGRQELMEMVKNMPESSYELSLKDLVDHSKVQGGFGESTACVDPLDTESSFDDSSITIQTEKKKKLLRSKSINSSGPILLKLVFPTSLGRKKKKKSLSAGTCAKVSPKPVEGGDKDKDWWKKRASVASAETETNGSSSSGSSKSNGSRNKDEPGCWSVFYTRKNKSMEQRENRF